MWAESPLPHVGVRTRRGVRTIRRGELAACGGSGRCGGRPGARSARRRQTMTARRSSSRSRTRRRLDGRARRAGRARRVGAVRRTTPAGTPPGSADDRGARCAARSAGRRRRRAVGRSNSRTSLVVRDPCRMMPDGCAHPQAVPRQPSIRGLEVGARWEERGGVAAEGEAKPDPAVSPRGMWTRVGAATPSWRRRWTLRRVPWWRVGGSSSNNLSQTGPSRSSWRRSRSDVSSSTT